MKMMLCMMVVTSAFADQAIKIAFVDVNKAIQNVGAGKKAREQLEKEFNAKKQEVASEEAALKKETETFKKQSEAWTVKFRTKKQNEIQERVMKFQEMTGRSQAELSQKERELTSPIISRMRTIIETLAKAKAYTIVLEKNENSVLYSLPQDDLTTDVITEFDKQN